jgi:HB1, ASXL, restriction endonuclease HTH domain
MKTDLHDLLKEAFRRLDLAQASLDAVRESLVAVVTQLGQKDLPMPRRPAKQAKTSMTDAAVRILRDAGRPMKTDEIVDSLMAVGHCQGRQDRKQLVNSVYSLLRQAPLKVAKTAPGQWSLREWDQVPSELSLGEITRLSKKEMANLTTQAREKSHQS